MTFEELLLRLWQYWVVMCSTRRGEYAKGSVEEEVTKIIRSFWKKREAIADDKFAAVKYYPAERALLIRRDGFEEALDWKSQPDQHPFRVFYPDRQFASAIRRFPGKTTYRWWREGKPLSLTGVAELIAFGRNFSTGALDVTRGVIFAGTLVQQPVADAMTVIGFKDLSEDEAAEYAALGKHDRFSLPEARAEARGMARHSATPVSLPTDPDSLLLLRILAFLRGAGIEALRSGVIALFRYLVDDRLGGNRVADAMAKLDGAKLVSVNRYLIEVSDSSVLDRVESELESKGTLPELAERFDDLAEGLLATRHEFDEPEQVVAAIAEWWSRAGKYEQALAAARAGGPALRQLRLVLLVRTGKYADAVGEVTADDDPSFLDVLVREFRLGRTTRFLVHAARNAPANVREMIRAACERQRMQEEAAALR